MNRIELAETLEISTSTLYRRIEKLNPSFKEKIKGEVLLKEDVKYIYENIQHSKKIETGSF